MYNILEVANTHAGDINYLFSLLKEYEEFKKEDNFGIKFQPFKYNTIATEDYEWYQVYTELFFNKDEWKKIIDKAFETKDVWIDLFDEYGIEIIKESLSNVKGIKLQTSILDNNIIFKELQKIDLSSQKLIINIAGREKEDIDSILNRFNSLNSNEILLEVGFQAYPTKLEDSGLSKISYLKENYTNKIVFADHINGKDEDAILLPLIAMMNGANYIEKHIMHSQLETKYDHFSSVVISDYKNLIEKQKKYYSLLDSPFLNEAEKNYINTTYQVPILKSKKEKYSLINFDEDIIFRRTNKKGLLSHEIKELLKTYHILNTDKRENETLKKEDFKKANIAAVIACRLKSTRLPQKALLKIGDLSSVELCLKNTMKFDNLNHVILATSDNEQDKELSNYTYNSSVVFHTGDPDDVIKRYLDVIDTLKIDVIVRITADMPYVSSEIFDFLLAEHFKSGADYTTAKDAAVGTNLEIINTSALKEVKKHFPNAKYSEYMTWYFQNNADYFHLNFVELPSNLVRDYRLTLDYDEDLLMFNKIEEYFSENNLEFSLERLFDFLDKNNEISSLNSHLTLKYKTDEKLINDLNLYTKIKEK